MLYVIWLPITHYYKGKKNLQCFAINKLNIIQLLKTYCVGVFLVNFDANFT